jgi:hypothetical protein
MINENVDPSEQYSLAVIRSALLLPEAAYASARALSSHNTPFFPPIHVRMLKQTGTRQRRARTRRHF